MLLSRFCKMDKRSGDWLHNSVNVLMNAEPYTLWLNFVLFINFFKNAASFAYMLVSLPR